MVARIWHGYTTPANADAYEAKLKPELLPGISAVPGYRGSYLFRRAHGTEVEFTTVLLWESLADIQAHAGPDYETAIIPADRRPLLTHFDATTQHYDVVGTHGAVIGRP